MANRDGFGVEGAGVETLTAARTLTRKDSGKLFIVGAVDLVASLPAAEPALAGVFFDFYVATISATTGFSLRPVAADQIRAPGITAADDKDLINTAATDAIGDGLRIICDGTLGWVVRDMRGTWAREP